MEYTKKFKERDELLQQLEDRGLAVPDRDAALNFLTRVGYFRSGAYRYVFRRLLPADEISERLHQYRSDDYIPGASIEHVMKLEAFDFKLARVCQEGLLEFEVRLRAAIAHTLASKDVAAHASKQFLDAQSCDKPTGEKTKFEAWSKTWRDAVTSAAEDEDFLKHHLLKYPEQDVPIWAVTEVLSFGSLPFLYELMQTPNAREVARMFGFNHPSRFGAVVRMLVDFRNACAPRFAALQPSFQKITLPRQARYGGHPARALARARLHENPQSKPPALHLRGGFGLHARIAHEWHQLASDLQDTSKKA